ncbi:MAG: histidine phosphatase family protein [Actinobacteria bacterium]|nr:histidine phosphatase family protein [Actinomycetota bacterium]
METTTVHLLRHGQVENPGRVLYGRLPGYHLSSLGVQMAEAAADYLKDVPLTHLRCSPLERARETMAPVAATRPELEVVIDERLIEAENLFAGKVFGEKSRTLLMPSNWWLLRNPFRPSWGEPYVSIVARMTAAVMDAAQAAGPGGQALVVSHQLPIWMMRSHAEGRRLLHDPRRRECTLASVTSIRLVDGRIAGVDYAEPAAHLLPSATTKKYVAGT